MVECIKRIQILSRFPVRVYANYNDSQRGRMFLVLDLDSIVSACACDAVSSDGVTLGGVAMIFSKLGVL